jgi:hypothetical protein
MKNPNRNRACEEIEKFARGLPGHHEANCSYGRASTMQHTLELNGQHMIITQEQFDDGEWQKKIQDAVR